MINYINIFKLEDGTWWVVCFFFFSSCSYMYPHKGLWIVTIIKYKNLNTLCAYVEISFHPLLFVATHAFGGWPLNFFRNWKEFNTLSKCLATLGIYVYSYTTLTMNYAFWPWKFNELSYYLILPSTHL